GRFRVVAGGFGHYRLGCSDRVGHLQRCALLREETTLPKGLYRPLLCPDGASHFRREDETRPPCHGSMERCMDPLPTEGEAGEEYLCPLKTNTHERSVVRGQPRPREVECPVDPRRGSGCPKDSPDPLPPAERMGAARDRRPGPLDSRSSP